MVLEPKVLIMDETLSSLDQTEQFKLLTCSSSCRPSIRPDLHLHLA
jgi:ABC-type dipeptide/oligopeptide/nickel transport system ATPase subunit